MQDIIMQQLVKIIAYNALRCNYINKDEVNDETIKRFLKMSNSFIEYQCFLFNQLLDLSDEQLKGDIKLDSKNDSFVEIFAYNDLYTIACLMEGLKAFSNELLNQEMKTREGGILMYAFSTAYHNVAKMAEIKAIEYNEQIEKEKKKAHLTAKPILTVSTKNKGKK